MIAFHSSYLQAAHAARQLLELAQYFKAKSVAEVSSGQSLHLSG